MRSFFVEPKVETVVTDSITIIEETKVATKVATKVVTKEMHLSKEEENKILSTAMIYLNQLNKFKRDAQLIANTNPLIEDDNMSTAFSMLFSSITQLEQAIESKDTYRLHKLLQT